MYKSTYYTFKDSVRFNDKVLPSTLLFIRSVAQLVENRTTVQKVTDLNYGGQSNIRFIKVPL